MDNKKPIRHILHKMNQKNMQNGQSRAKKGTLQKVDEARKILDKKISASNSLINDKTIFKISRYIDQLSIDYLKDVNRKVVITKDKLYDKDCLYHTLFENHNSIMMLIDPDNGNIIKANKAALNYYGYPKNKLLTMSIHDINILTEYEIHKEMELAKVEKRNHFQFIHRTANNELKDVEVYSQPIDLGVRKFLFSIIHDITSKKVYEKELFLFRKILENNSEGVVITNPKGEIQWINGEFTKITGYTLGEVKGYNINILKSGKQEQEFYGKMWEELKKKGKWKGQIWNRNKNGDIYFEWLTIDSIKIDSDHVSHYVGIFKDLTERNDIVRQINDLQQKDSLTGLYNSNYFLQQVHDNMELCKKEQRKSAVILINIKDFKEINNSLGQAVGDKLLIEMSKRLSNYVTKNHILARFRGDEFIVLCKAYKKIDEIVSYGKVLLHDLKAPFMIENSMIHINYNVSISRYPKDGSEVDTFIRCADIAMNKAKEKSIEEPFLYEPHMSKQVDERFLLSNQLVDAITNNELDIYYQPIFLVEDPSVIVAAEALLRWNNSIFGMVSPSKFIPTAEKIGQIIPIGEWALKHVCRQINMWKTMGKKLIPISVNMSVKQLELVGFSKRVIDILKSFNIEAQYIDLEITESVSSGDVGTIVNNLKELKAFGIKISMDDFGTGFSSLGQLDLFELDKLKIDKIFIDDLVNVTKRQNLVKSIIAMAKGLNLSVIAEGIESKEQLEFLQQLGCQMGQGYYVSKPLPVDQFIKLMK